jgi:hypothetical protein
MTGTKKQSKFSDSNDGSCTKYLSVDSPPTLILFIFILLTSNQYIYHHEHPADEPMTARARGRRHEDAGSREYISPAMTRGRRT